MTRASSREIADTVYRAMSWRTLALAGFYIRVVFQFYLMLAMVVISHLVIVLAPSVDLTVAAVVVGLCYAPIEIAIKAYRNYVLFSWVVFALTSVLLFFWLTHKVTSKIPALRTALEVYIERQFSILRAFGDADLVPVQ